jgi:hypothetical protein
MGEKGGVRFQAKELSAINLDLTTHVPDVRERPLLLEFFLNDELLSSLNLIRNGWVHVDLAVSPDFSTAAKGEFELRICAGRTWQPRPTQDETRDDREISIAVCNVEIRG